MKIVDLDMDEDVHGITPCCLVSGKDANPRDIHQWLFSHYQGYKFAVVFDCTKDEWEYLEKNTPVYFLDTLDEEFLEYIGIQRVKEWLEKRLN